MEDIINYVKEWNLESSKTGLKDFIASKEQKSRNDGIRIGRTEGHHEEKLTIAKNMLNRKLSIEDIMAFTGLSKKEILSLK